MPYNGIQYIPVAAPQNFSPQGSAGPLVLANTGSHSRPNTASSYASSSYAPSSHAPSGYAPSGYAPSGYAPNGYAPSSYPLINYPSNNNAYTPAVINQQTNSKPYMEENVEHTTKRKKVLGGLIKTTSTTETYSKKQGWR